MSNLYLKLVGSFTAATMGRIDRYSDEHRAFLSSGYVCGGCRRTLMRWWGVADVAALSPQGTPVPLTQARRRADRWRCPKCQHTWPFRSA